MLVLTRRRFERLHLHVPGVEKPWEVVMVEFRSTQRSRVAARVGIDAPEDVKIYRAEDCPICGTRKPGPLAPYIDELTPEAIGVTE